MNNTMKVVVGLITAFVALIALIAAVLVAKYNNMTALNQKVEATWADVENNYQRRTDLIPNLVNTVKGYASHEKVVFEQVARLRSRVDKVDPSLLATNAAARSQYIEAQNQMSGALGRLLAIQENYPELKANEQFRSLQDELAGTENRIANARNGNVQAVNAYNTTISKFPNSVIANSAGFKPKAYFQASSTTNPTVSF